MMSRRNSRVIESQLKQIDELFRINENSESVVKVIDIKKDKNCDVHGLSRRGSTDSCKSTVIRRGSTASNVDLSKRNSICGTDSLNKNAALRKRNRNSISSITDLVHRSVTPNGRSESIDRELFNRPRRDSAPIIHENSRSKRNVLDTWNSRLFKGMEHPSNFPSMLRSSTSTLNIVPLNKGHNNDKGTMMSRRASSNWNVNHFHNYNGTSNGNNLNKELSKSTSDKIFKRDFANGNKSNSISPEPKKEFQPTSILKHKKHEDDLKEIIKRLSFEYIEKEHNADCALNGHKVDSDLLSNSDSSSGTPAVTFVPKLSLPRRISIDSLDSRRSSRRFSDFSINGDDDEADDLVLLKNKLNNHNKPQVKLKLLKKKLMLLLLQMNLLHIKLLALPIAAMNDCLNCTFKEFFDCK